jgi:DNA-binding GntR family transcriptional regulator
MSALHEHTRVLTAIAARDVPAAVAALRAHIESAHLRALGISADAEAAVTG